MKTFSLQTVLDVRSQTRDESLGELAIALTEVATRQLVLDRLNREQTQTRSHSEMSVARLAEASRTRVELQRQIKQAINQLQAANEIVSACRKQLEIAEREVAELEQLRERRADQQRSQKKRRLEKEQLEQLAASVGRRH